MQSSVQSIKELTTFGVEVTARNVVEITSEKELRETLKRCNDAAEEVLILGGGSNILFTKDFQGTVIVNKIGGIHCILENGSWIIIESGAGVVWHNLVMHCVEKGWGGIENLALIPGSVGASPMQNIGAYGVELKDVFHSLDAMDRRTGEIRTFSAVACNFGYRESVFKRELKDRYVIIRVRVQLTKPNYHNIVDGYGNIQQELATMGIQEPNIQDIAQAVIRIRQQKLPDPAVLGNAGSFFKNPVVEQSVADEILKKFPEAMVYPVSQGYAKLAAGWLIEQAGWKGRTLGRCAVHNKQALVLVNMGGATGLEILNLASAIQKDVESMFGVALEREVNVI
jgi:UDP-N-acetylmuramate dehydrogenase